MDQEKYIKTGALETILQAIPDSITGNSVVIKIERVSDGYTWNFTALEFQDATNTGIMTIVSGSVWKSTFTPDTADSFVITITNPNLTDIYYYKYYQSSDSAPTTPSAPSGTDLITLAKVKEYLQITDADDDTFLTSLISNSSILIKSYCKRDFTSTSYTEYHNGNGATELVLNNYPIISITSVHDDMDRDYDSATLLDSDDYVYHEKEGILELDGLTFRKGVKNIKVVYVAGYATIPIDIGQACIEIAAKKYKAGKDKKQGVTQESLGERSITFKDEDIPKEARIVLDSYARITV